MNKTDKKRIAFFYVLDLILAAILVFLDRLSKLAVVDRLKGKQPFSIIGDFFTFRYLENKGAAFSILQDQRIFFLIIGMVISVLILIALLIIPAFGKYHSLRLCLVFLFSGAVGNMVDRYTQSYVVDFISVGTFPVFNVADIYVTVSTFTLVILVLFVFKEDELDIKKARTPKIHSSMIFREDKENESSEDVAIVTNAVEKDSDGK